jgi:hypothetical protein
MSRNSAIARIERPPAGLDMNLITNEEITHLVAACNDPNNAAAANLLAFSGTRTVSGVIAKLVRSGGEERETLLQLIRSAIHEHNRLHPRD